jgi:hypothetical protein
MKSRAEQIARQVTGVRDVVNGLRIQAADSPGRRGGERPPAYSVPELEIEIGAAETLDL